MIWQLMKRDPTWKIGAVTIGVMFAVMAAALEFLPLSQASRESLRAGFGFVAAGSVWFTTVMAFSIQSRLALYEAALPIAGRDAWLSRVLSLLAMIWLPVSIAMLIAIALGFPLLPLLQASAIFAVLVLAAKCVRIQVLGGAPQWLGAAGFLVPFLAAAVGMIVAPSAIKHLKSASWFVLPPTASVLTICGLASAALFAWGWVNVPKSVQIATAELRSDRRSLTKEPSEFTWAPAFQSIYRPRMIPILVFLMINVFFGFVTGNVLSGFSFTAIFVLGSSQVRGQCRWLLALPVSPRRVFGWIMIPPTAAVLIACLAAILIPTKHPLSPNARLLDVTAELAVLYGLIFLNELFAWRRLSKFRATRWGVWILGTPFVIGLIAPIFVLPDTEAMRRLAGVLPGTWWQLACILAIPVIATYWLAEKAFREQEYRPDLRDKLLTQS